MGNVSEFKRCYVGDKVQKYPNGNQKAERFVSEKAETVTPRFRFIAKCVVTKQFRSSCGVVLPSCLLSCRS